MGGLEFLSCTVQFFSLGGHAVGLGLLLIFFFWKYLAQLLEPKQNPRKCHSLYKLKGKVHSIPIAAKYHSVCSYCNWANKIKLNATTDNINKKVIKFSRFKYWKYLKQKSYWVQWLLNCFLFYFKNILSFTFFLHQGNIWMKLGRGSLFSLSTFPVQRVALNKGMFTTLLLKVGNRAQPQWASLSLFSGLLFHLLCFSPSFWAHLFIRIMEATCVPKISLQANP